MSKSKTVEESIPDMIKFYIEEAGKLSEAYEISRTEALQIITLIELAKIHTHIDGMANVLQVLDKNNFKG